MSIQLQHQCHVLFYLVSTITMYFCLVGLPRESINEFQKAQNCAARLVLGMRKLEHITPALKTLHWLPVQQRIQYKTSLTCQESIHSLTPPYISDSLSPYTTARTLRSTSAVITHNCTLQGFSSNNIWRACFLKICTISLEHSSTYIPELKTTSSFKSNLKTHFFCSFQSGLHHFVS